MKVLITGGAGFLGSHLCDLWLSRGHSVVCMDSFITGKRGNIEHLLADPLFQVAEQDVTREIGYEGELDLVLHFASPASPVHYARWPIETLKVGALGTLNALELARKQGARFLLASTSEVYGDPSVSPQPETYWGNVNPVGPRSVYDEAKRYAEALTQAYLRVYSMDCKIVRIFNTYGPRMQREDGRAVPAFICQALKGEPLTIFGDGQQTRSFCYVQDLVEGVYRLALSNVQGPVNLGNPQEITILELAQKIIQLTGSRSPIEFRPLPQDDPQRRNPDISRARLFLGWEPHTSLAAGLTQTIRWFQFSE